LWLLPIAAAAQTPAETNTCVASGGAGTPCTSQDDCAFRAWATRCVQQVRNDATSRRCEIPCADADDPSRPDRGACAPGETCTASPGDGAWYCKPSKFRVDLNLLDQCVAHFLSGLAPVLGGTNQCSLEANLNRLLDQDSDADFDIFDLDLCVQSYFAQPVCDPRVGTCPADDLVFCRTDQDCGRGLYCDPERAFCTRDCGTVASREAGIGALDRTCAGRLKACDRERGRCQNADLTGSMCTADRDCPRGAYCFLGTCAPTCSRSLDCPDSAWFCTANGRCRVRPSPASASGFTFDPKNYSILFASTNVTLTDIEYETSTRILVMDLTTKREVLDNPSVGFGYRVEVTYGFKDDPKCKKSPEDWSLAERADCLIDDTEEFITPLSPFGTVFATGRPAMRVRLNTGAAARLTPGAYYGYVDVIYDNGGQDRFKVSYVKSTPSGEYVGGFSVFMDHADNALGGSEGFPLTMRLKVQPGTTTWNALLNAEGLASESRDITDLTSGFPVNAYLHGNESLPFAWPAARTPAQNEIPLKGIYSPQLGTMRLIGVVGLDADFCRGETGACNDQEPDEMRVTNPFGRSVRRIIQFAGGYDGTTRRFSGVYREKLTGLHPGADLTLDGTFLVAQKQSDETDLVLAAPLLDANAGAVDFPPPRDVMTQVQADIATWCGGATGGSAATTKFATAQSYSAYLSSFSTQRVFGSVVRFGDLVQDALNGLGTDARSSSMLTLYDYLAGRIVLCDPETGQPPGAVPGTTSEPACVNERQLRCGLALSRRAVLAPLVTVSDLGNARTGQYPIFCSAVMPTGPCDPSADVPAALRTLHEHNRFHQELSQAVKFQADRDVSDAFFALYRNRLNPFTQGQALSFKAEKLRTAYAMYDELLDLIAGAPAASVLFQWPMSYFESIGNTWLKQMQVLVADRLETRAQLVDLRRRIFANTGTDDQLLGEHLAQQDYLLQVYLMALQRQWQGPGFAYAGAASPIFEKLEKLLLQLHASRNPLGISPDRVFFENSDPTRENWHNYLAFLVGQDGSGGLMARARTQIDQAVANLQASLRDVDALEATLSDEVGAYQDTLEGLCGAEQPASCAALLALLTNRNGTAASIATTLLANTTMTCDDHLWNTHSELGGLDVSAGDSDLCTQAEAEFRSGVTDGDSEIGCPWRSGFEYLSVRGQLRACVGGEMGALLRERSMLERKRKSIANGFNGLVTQLQDFMTHRNQVEEQHVAERVLHIVRWVLETVFNGWENSAKSFDDIQMDMLEKLPGCLVIAGVAAGTTCAGDAAGAVAAVAKDTVKGAVNILQDGLAAQLVSVLDLADAEFEYAIERADAKLELKGMMNGVGDHVDAYLTNLQALWDVEVRIQEAKHNAKLAAAGLDDQVTFVVDRLVGRETGSVLVGNYLVRESEKTFRRILDATYRTVGAFAHRYNLTPAARRQLENAVFQAVTLEDVQAVLDDLQDRERTYCGREGIDCDAFNNLATLRVSLRDELFPNLRDVMDPSTGSVVTKGQQFHNIITAPPYLRRRIRGVWPVDQIEIPFTVGLNMQDNTGTGRWLLTPTQCNHIIEGDERGTLAVNVVGRNLSDPARAVHYEIVRGHIDQLRECHPTTVTGEPGTIPTVQYPITTQVVGYAPESMSGQLISPPTFVTRSAELPACVNQPEAAGEPIPETPCWRTFARDRSLAAPYYLLTLPLRVNEGETVNTWLAGEGLPEARRPIVEDLVVYLRYRTRPIAEP